MVKIYASSFHRDTSTLKGTKDNSETTTKSYQEQNILCSSETGASDSVLGFFFPVFHSIKLLSANLTAEKLTASTPFPVILPTCSATSYKHLALAARGILLCNRRQEQQNKNRSGLQAHD